MAKTTRYHINIHGEPAKCTAEIKCTAQGAVTDANGTVEHFDGTPKQAREWAEQRVAEEAQNSSFSTVSTNVDTDGEHHAQVSSYLEETDDPRARKTAAEVGEYFEDLYGDDVEELDEALDTAMLELRRDSTLSADEVIRNTERELGAAEAQRQVDAKIEENKKYYINPMMGSNQLDESYAKKVASRIVDEQGSDLSEEDKDAIKEYALAAYRGRTNYGGGSPRGGVESAVEYATSRIYQLNSAGSSKKKYDTEQVEYSGRGEISDNIADANARWGVDAKTVKSNEKRALQQAGDKLPVVKKRKNSKTGYRDTTVYSSDGERFVTIRANEDNPNASYYIKGSTDGHTTAGGLYYGADSAVSDLRRYSDEVSGAGKSSTPTYDPNADHLVAARNRSARGQVFSTISKYDKSATASDKSSDLSGVKVSESQGSRQISFYDGSSIRVSESADGSSGTYEYLGSSGEVLRSGNLDTESSKDVERDIKRAAHSSRSLKEYDVSADEIRDKVGSDPAYKSLRVITEGTGYSTDQGGKERVIQIAGRTGNVGFVQLSTDSNIDGEPDVMYDTMSMENIEDGGIYMKNETREQKMGSLNRYLDALVRKDRANDHDGSLYDYM